MMLEKTPNKAHQNILRSGNLAGMVLRFALTVELDHMERVHKLDNEFSTLTSEEETSLREDIQRSRSWLFDVVKKSVFVSTGFVHGNKKNQEDLLQIIEVLLVNLK